MLCGILTGDKGSFYIPLTAQEIYRLIVFDEGYSRNASFVLN